MPRFVAPASLPEQGAHANAAADSRLEVRPVSGSKPDQPHWQAVEPGVPLLPAPHAVP